jgi:pSer/pThr/pTyr-binding forkhead associated (FHA) protein
MARLIMLRGPSPGTIYELNGDIVTIGRGSKNNVIIRDDEVSREHCRLIRVMADYELQDLSSSNGTFVDGQRLRGNRLLHSGNIIELGDSITMEYEQTASASDTLARKTQEFVPAVQAENAPASTGKPHLILVSNFEPTQVFPLEERVVSVGRDLSNTIVIQDPEVSRFHIRLLLADNGYIIEDLGSTNGTLVNGVRLTEPRPLKDGDNIEIGMTAQMRYTYQPDNVPSIQSPQRAPTASLPPISLGGNRVETVKTSLLGATTKKEIRKGASFLGTGLQEGALKDHIFVSYAREDWETIIAPLTVTLQDAGLSLWVDQYLVQGEEAWMEAIEQALHECWLMLVVVSPQALNSQYVKLEYRYFFNREKPIIPILYKPIDALPPELSGSRTIRYDTNDPNRAFQRLVFEIMQLRQ